MLIACVLAIVASTTTGCTGRHDSSANPLPEETTRTTQEDAEVIETALLRFFSNDEWIESDWDTGEVLVLDPTWKKRTELFFDAVQGDLKQIEYTAKNSKYKVHRQRAEQELGALKPILEDVRGTKEVRSAGERSPPEMRPSLVSLVDDMDERIIVSEEDPYPYDISRNMTIKDRSGVKRTWRTKCWIGHPQYSASGKYAFVQVVAPWSIHSADINFYLERVGDDWTVKCAAVTIYP